MTDRTLLAYVDLEGVPHIAGRLWTRSRKGRESATFEYDAAWLANPLRFALERRSHSAQGRTTPRRDG
jgi:serine/threonine-protein kinase HipA